MGDHVPLFLCVASVFPAEKKDRDRLSGGPGPVIAGGILQHCQCCARGRLSFGLAADEIARAFAHDLLDAQDAEDAKGYLHGHGEVAMVKTCPGSAAPSTWNRGAWKMPWKMACRKKSGKL